MTSGGGSMCSRVPPTSKQTAAARATGLPRRLAPRDGHAVPQRPDGQEEGEGDQSKERVAQRRAQARLPPLHQAEDGLRRGGQEQSAEEPAARHGPGDKRGRRRLGEDRKELQQEGQQRKRRRAGGWPGDIPWK